MVRQEAITAIIVILPRRNELLPEVQQKLDNYIVDVLKGHSIYSEQDVFLRKIVWELTGK